MDSSERIKITITGKTPFIWKAKDVHCLRKEHRIVGTLTGCLPRVPFQNNLLGLPLQLSNEEARFLLEKGVAQLEVLETNSIKERFASSKDLGTKYKETREKVYNEQNKLYKEERCKKIEIIADAIVEGKRKRQLEKMQGLKGKKKKRERENLISNSDVNMDIEIDRDAAIQEELDKIVDVPRTSCTVQLFTECPWQETPTQSNSDFKFPETEHSKIRYQVFKDLWSKGLYITGGSKFGADFLAYPGDPLRYHAFFMVVCTGYSDQLPGLDMVTLGRLSTQVKKTLVLATVKPDGTVDYISINWAGLDLTPCKPKEESTNTM